MEEKPTDEECKQCTLHHLKNCKRKWKDCPPKLFKIPLFGDVAYADAI